MPRRTSEGRRRRGAALFAAGALFAAPLAAYAGDSFSDVPDSNIFHDDIDWMADNGVTQGCGGDRFCPDDTVTREQMSAFMRRLDSQDVFATPDEVDSTVADAIADAAPSGPVDADTLDGLNSTAFLRDDGKAADADTLDGLDSSAFAVRQEAMTFLDSVYNSETVTLTDSDPDYTMASTTVVLPDECGDGSTVHRVLVDAAAQYFAGPGDATGGVNAAGAFTVDGVLAVEGGLIGWRVGSGVAAVGLASSMHGVLQLPAGSSTVALVDLASSREATDPNLRFAQVRMTLTHAGWGCPA